MGHREVSIAKLLFTKLLQKIEADSVLKSMPPAYTQMTHGIEFD